jgi:hypothetical protein
MRFSSMAVSVLTQSVPLLAVGHRAGWKRREERSWLQSRRLRDALLVGVHDKNGIVLENRVGVHVKQDKVLEKKRAGSARLVQDKASSEVISDDREASGECDPLSRETDSGMFGCDMDSHCVESEESKLGGFCVALKQAPSINRALRENVTCVEKPSEEYAAECNCTYTCDCSQFNNTSGFGTFTCTEEDCFEESGEVCATFRTSYTNNADGTYEVESCFEFSGDLGAAAPGLESYCSSENSDLNSTECEIKVNDVVCNSCEFQQATCPANSSSPLRDVFDCTNTVMNIQGNECASGSVVGSFLDAGVMPTTTSLETGPPSASPAEMPTTDAGDMPTTTPFETGPPSASPVEMPSPATSSGRSLTAKVAIVVSAAAAAWMASFGT